MKNWFFSMLVIVSLIIVSCAGNSDEEKNKAAEDSIKKVDSMANIMIGTWKADGKKVSLKIERSGELYTITDDGETYAYKLDGQILISVDGSGPAYSLVGDNQLLKGSTKYTKSDSDDQGEVTDAETEDDADAKTKKGSDPTSSKKTTKTKTTTTTTINETADAATVPVELTIVCDNTINLFQNPRSGAAIVKGLSNGTVCTVISKGSQITTFGGKKDYWYNVKVDGFKGWVFGAYTSVSE